MPKSLEPRSLKSNSRRAEILRAATTLFLERGYSGTSTDAIVERSGGSKETVYAHFGSKAGLFEAVVEQAASTTIAALQNPSLDADEPQRELRRIGIDFLTALADPDTIALMRLIVAETERVPGIRMIFVRSGPMQAEAAIAAFLDRCRAARSLCIPDLNLYAAAFAALVLAPVLGSLVTAEPLSERAIVDHIETVVPLFVKLCRTRETVTETSASVLKSRR